MSVSRSCHLSLEVLLPRSACDVQLRAMSVPIAIKWCSLVFQKKKWSFRSISFSKKDKTKPSRDETPKNGDVTKEEPLAEVNRERASIRKYIATPSDGATGNYREITCENTAPFKTNIECYF